MFECLKIYPESRTIKSLDPTVALDWGGQAYSNKAIADSGGVTFGGGNPGNKTKAYGGQKVLPRSTHTPFARPPARAPSLARQLPFTIDSSPRP